MASARNEFDALGDLESIGAVVRSQQLMASMTAISGTLSSFWNLMGDLLRAGQADAATEALRTSFDWDAPLLKLNITAQKRAAMKESITEAGRFNVEAMIARIYKSRIPLSEQVYKTQALTDGWVESRIDAALGRGATVARLRDEVVAFVDPNVKGGASYAAKRLARTEINNAYHAVTIVHNEDKPWNEGMQWNLSGSHPTVDICDTYARRDHSKLGKGVFPLGEVPAKPHPQCLCYTFPKTMEPGAFLDRLVSGDWDGYLKESYNFDR